MLFGILKHFDSLRELEIGMKAEAHKLRHLGMSYLVRRSTLAEANIRCHQEFFASVYAYLLEKYAKFLTYSSFCRIESSLTTDIHWCSQQFKRFRDISTFEIVQ